MVQSPACRPSRPATARRPPARGVLAGAALLLAVGSAGCSASSGHAGAATSSAARSTAITHPVPPPPTAALTTPAALPTLIPTDLLNAPVPAYCRHAAGKLVNGNLPVKHTGAAADPGFATVLGPQNTKAFGIPPVLTDLNGDGAAELAGVLRCSAGGVTWPDLILAYTAGRTGPTLLGSLPMGDVTHSEHSQITSLSGSGGSLHLRWHSAEGCCFFNRTWSATVRWNGGKLAVEGVKQLSGPVGDMLSTDSTIGPDGLGPVRLGQTTAEAKEATSPALEYTPAGAGYCDAFSAPGLSIALPGTPTHRVEMISVHPGGVYSRIRTSRGIHLGSTVAQVRAAYPAATHVGHGIYGVGEYYRVSSGADALAISIEAGKVTALNAATRSALALDELCG